jgi:hypothetical protein
MSKIKYFLAAGFAISALVILSSFGENQTKQADQLKKIDEMVEENVNAFVAKKNAECKAMALQRAIGVAETEMAAIPKSESKTAAKKATAPKKTVEPAPKPVPTPTDAKKDRMKGGESGNDDATKAKKDRMKEDSKAPDVMAPATKSKKDRMKEGGL